jgi:lipopolysaccharide export system permease protein
MRLLDRYLLRELLVPLGYCLGGFLLFWIAFDLTSSLGKYQDKKLVMSDVVELYIVKLPDILVLILPIVLLLALLYALTNHARHHELTAIRAAGVSLARICAPYFGVGLLFGLVLFYLNERIVPESANRQEAILQRHETGQAGAKRAHIVVNGRLGHEWIFNSYNSAAHEFTQVEVNWTSANGDKMKLVAERADHPDGGWTFYGAEEFRNLVPTGASDTTIVVPELTETPDQIRREVEFPGRMASLSMQPVEISIAEILDYLSVHPADLTPEYRRWLLTQLHGRIAAPWTCLVVVLIAIPFGAASGRRNLFVGVASSIVICFVYFVLLRLGLALGTSGFLPPWLAAWFPNLSFGIAATWLMLRVR